MYLSCSSHPSSFLCRKNISVLKSLICKKSSSTARPQFYAHELQKTLAADLKPLVPKEKLIFGHTFTDHMLSIEYKNRSGWSIPRINPYSKISLYPSASVFHYASECFEGMKAYKDKEGNIRLFRPDMNMNRLLNSVQRLALPEFNKEEFLECLKELLRIDSRWVPAGKGYSLYIRPTVIGTQETVGVTPSKDSMMFVICCPVGPYFKCGFRSVSLYAAEDFVRAWPGGTGAYKLGMNYSSMMLPQITAKKMGCEQVLSMIGEEYKLSEIGTMNCFVFLENEQGVKELVTPPLDGTILPGVTRDSIISLAKEWKEFQVSERDITIFEVLKASKEQRLIEMFGAGTACIVCPIKRILFKGEEIKVPLDPNDSTQEAGPLTRRINETLLSIQYGEISHPWSVVV